MHNSHLITLLAETGLSPEALGDKIGVSGMTLRRWLTKPESDLVTEPYVSAFHSAIQKMVVDGIIDGTSQSAQWSFSVSGTLSHGAALKCLGYEGELTPEFVGQEEKVYLMLNQIGSKKKSRSEVDTRRNEIIFFKRFGKAWTKRINYLVAILDSQKSYSYKFIAYGALFYLIFPFDLIPDSIPVFGYLDDFAIMGLAVKFYMTNEMKVNLRKTAI